jgi:hypothetical protein
MRKSVWFVSIAALASVLVLAPQADAAGRPFHTTLSGAEEIPGPGDPDGSGEAVLTLNHG